MTDLFAALKSLYHTPVFWVGCGLVLVVIGVFLMITNKMWTKKPDVSHAIFCVGILLAALGGIGSLIIGTHYEKGFAPTTTPTTQKSI